LYMLMAMIHHCPNIQIFNYSIMEWNANGIMNELMNRIKNDKMCKYKGQN
jgi:hypothetical protein